MRCWTDVPVIHHDTFDGVIAGFLKPDEWLMSVIGRLQGSDHHVAVLLEDLTPGDEVETYLMTQADSTISPSFSLARMQYIVVSHTDEEGATFEIESVRLMSRVEYYASNERLASWEGLEGVYHQTLVGLPTTCRVVRPA